MDPQWFKANNRPDQTRPPTDQLSHLPPPPPPRYGQKDKLNKSKWPIVLIVLLVIVLGLVAWAYLGHKAKPTSANNSTSSSIKTKAKNNNPSSSSASSPSVPTPSIPTTPYTSSTFSLSFNYPSSWNLVDSGSAGITVSSPVMSLTSANGQSVQGQIVLSILKQGAVPSAFTSSSVAVMSSQKIQYNSPAQGQAAATYITFAQYPSTVTKGGLDGIYLTGNYGYQKDQVIPSSNIAQIDPLIYFSFYSCTSSACPVSSKTPLTIAGSTNWSDSTFQTPVVTILKSFSFN